MAETRQASVPTWLTILLVVALVLALWALVTARGAAGEAAANTEQLARPDLDLAVVPGGPQRFPDAFDAAVDDLDDDDVVDATTHRWITVVLHNDGASDAQGVDVTLDLGSIDAQESAQVFVGVAADALPEPVAEEWSTAYRSYLGRADVFVDGNDVAIDRWYGGLL